MKELGYGHDYRYAHDEPEGYVAGEQYFPEQMPQQRYYYPVERGLEQQIKARLDHFRELDAQVPGKEKNRQTTGRLNRK
jgi:putative ATPase